jgi:hypothetical protein
MLQILGEHIAACHHRAAECKGRAEQAADPTIKTELLDLERAWAHLARSYEFVETLERFLLSAHNHPNQEVIANGPTSADQGRTE